MSQLTDPLARVTIVTGTEIRGQKGGEVSEHIGYLHIRILIRSLHHYTTQFSMLAHTIPHTGYTIIIHYYKLLHIERVKKISIFLWFLHVVVRRVYYQGPFMNSHSWNLTTNCSTIMKHSNWLGL